jgi:hypothetical protein
MRLLFQHVAARKRIATAPSGGASLSLTWEDNSAIEDGFRIYTKLTSGSTYALAKTVGANVESTTLTGLAYGTSYDVKVASYNGSGEYTQVGPVTRYTPPQYAPTSLSATTTLSTSVTVGFTAAAGVTSYQGYYRATGSSTWLTGPAITSGTAITFTGLEPVTEYDFKVRGFFANPSPQAPSYGPDSATLTETTELLSLGWNGEQLIADLGDGIVNTDGTLITAVCLGQTGDRTINGVTFDGQSTIGNLDAAYYNPDLYQRVGIGSDFAIMMDHLAYVDGSANGEITLTGLTIGDTYLLQVFSSDERASFNTRNQAFAIAGYTSSPMVTGNSFASICMFVASSTSHTLVISDPDGAGSTQLQGFQLRKL